MSRHFQVFPGRSFRIEPPLSEQRRPLPGKRSGADAKDWSLSKKLVDTLPEHRNLWRIKNKMYDLTTFAEHHPGRAERAGVFADEGRSRQRGQQLATPSRWASHAETHSAFRCEMRAEQSACLP